MPYKRTLRGSVVWQASYYVDNELLPADARKGVKKTRVYERADAAGYPNSQGGAKSLESRRRREIREGTYSYQAQGRYTGSSWLREWTEKRTTRNRHADKRCVELHFLPFRDFATKPLVDFRTRDIRDWAHAAKQRVVAGEISGKTIRNAYGNVHTMFHDAVVNEIIAVNPCVLSRGDLPAKKTKQARRYQEEESSGLAWEPRLPVDVRVLFSILTFTGERVGEAVGHRWLDLDRDTHRMWALTLEFQYELEPLKTSTDKERPRVIPVHPELRRVLTWWHDVGFEEFYGRRPRPTDPIIPNFFKRGHHTRKSIYHRSRDGFDAGEMFWKGHHACRHALITAARRRNANPLWLDRITHNAEGTILDRYTDTVWEPLCDVIATLPWAAPENLSGDPATHSATRSGDAAETSLVCGAGEGIRTLDVNLGKVALYH